MPPADRIGTDRVFCEYCDASGRRSLLFPAPDGWFYIAAVDAQARTTFYTYACGPACRDALWQRGPGPALPGVSAQVGAAIRAREGAPVGAVYPDPGFTGTPGAATRSCILDEGACKAADCPIHGWCKTR
jgi:hypothetical protein